MTSPPFTLQQSVELPKSPMPIVSIGLGGIVNDAHYPAYQKVGFELAGGFDLNPDRAAMMQAKFGIGTIYDTLRDAIHKSPSDTIFDVAVPGSVVLDIVKQIPPNRAVLIQKPLGETLDQAREIVRVCRERRLKSAVNFQMRYVPYIIAAQDMIDRGMIGEILDLEIRIQAHTPWEKWPFFVGIPRVEILYHSIHYIDLFRYLLGDPRSIYAKTLRNPITPELASTRSTIIMDYGDQVRATILTNHGHIYGIDKQESYIKWEGSKGAIKIRIGLLLGYPKGLPDLFEYVILEDGKSPEWKTYPIEGTWFPEAFIGPMACLMRFASGETDELCIDTEDAIYTMAAVEAAYMSSEQGGTSIPLA